MLSLYKICLSQAEYYVQVAVAAGREYDRGGKQGITALARFDDEQDQIETACNWLQEMPVTGDKDRLLIQFATIFGTIYTIRGIDWAGRISLMEAALDAARRQGDRNNEADTLASIGAIYYAQGQRAQALAYYQEAILVAVEAKNRKLEGIVYGDMGLVYLDLGEIERSIEYQTMHLRVAEEFNDPNEQAIAHNNLGLAYAELGDTHRSVEYYEQALPLVEETQDLRLEVTVLGNLAVGQDELGAGETAERLYKRTIWLARRIQDRFEEARTCWNLGLLYERQGHFEQAVRLTEFAVLFLEEIAHSDAAERRERLEGIRAKAAFLDLSLSIVAS